MDETQHVMRAPVALDQCSVARTLAQIGDYWTLLILREAFYGVTRFEAMRADLAVPRSILSQRLHALVDQGILQRAAYQAAGQRARFEYRLTPKGRALLPVLIALMQWGDAYVPTAETPTLTLAHVDCGARVLTRFVCDNGHVVEDTRELTAQVRGAQ